MPKIPEQQQQAAHAATPRELELSALSSHLQSLAEKEKTELARTLHDELGGLLTAAKMDLSWLQTRVDKAEYQERLAQLGSVLDEAMNLKRRVVEELRPSLLDHFGLPTALRAYAESVCAKANIQADIRLPDGAAGIPKEIAIALFRIVQEGLNNVVRHAGARRVELDLSCAGNEYAFTLHDDGCGFNLDDTRDSWPHGIMGMQHRVRALGGRFALESAPGKGTTLRVAVPIER
jgi:signal transduction histidine kinase